MKSKLLGEIAEDLVITCIALIALLTLGALYAWALCSAPVQTQYFVSPTGSDSNSGLDSAHAWQTTNKVNTFTFPFGSIVSFQGGGSFIGCLTFNRNNVPAGNITVNSYGTGNALITSGGAGCVPGDNAAHVFVDSISNFTWNGINLVGGIQSTSNPAGTYSMYPAVPTGTGTPESNANPLTRGVKFVPQVNASITQLRYYKTASDTSTLSRNLNLWPATSGAALATCATTAPEPTGTDQWVSCTLGTSYPAAAGSTYIVTTDSAANELVFDRQASPCSNAVRSSPILCIGSVYHLGAVSTYPEHAQGGGFGYYADVVATTSSTFNYNVAITATGILLTNNGGSKITNLTVQNSSIGGGYQRYPGTFHSGNIFVWGDSWPNAVNGAIDNINILNNTILGSSVTALEGPGFYTIPFGQNLTNITLKGNTVYNLGLLAPSGAIGAAGAKTVLIDHNLIHDIGGSDNSCGGSSGIEMYQSDSSTIQYNEVYNVQPFPSYVGGCDWDGIDIDAGSTNSIVQYNYTHHNYGAGLYAFDQTAGYPWGPTTYRYNISENDGQGQNASVSVAYVPPSGLPVQLYNNTIDVSSITAHSGAACMSFALYTNGVFPAGSLVENNLCRVTTTAVYGVANTGTGAPITGLTFANNSFFGNHNWLWANAQVTTLAAWQATSSGDINDVGTDPLLVSPGNGGTLTWNPTTLTGPLPGPNQYQLQTGSPDLGAGIAITGQGMLTYFGTAISSPPNIGAF